MALKIVEVSESLLIQEWTYYWNLKTNSIIILRLLGISKLSVIWWNFKIIYLIWKISHRNLTITFIFRSSEFEPQNYHTLLNSIAKFSWTYRKNHEGQWWKILNALNVMGLRFTIRISAQNGGLRKSFNSGFHCFKLHLEFEKLHYVLLMILTNNFEVDEWCCKKKISFCSWIFLCTVFFVTTWSLCLLLAFVGLFSQSYCQFLLPSLNFI